MATPGSPKYTDQPLKIVGSTKFGQFPKISSEQTFNMTTSDGYFVPFPGFKRAAVVNPVGVGRGIYASNKLNKLFAVIDNNIYTFDDNLTSTLVGSTTTTVGDVFISENNNGQVVFSDSVNMYVYVNSLNTVDYTLTQAYLGFTPGYLTYQNGRIISPDLSSNQWRLSQPNNVLPTISFPVPFPNTNQFVGAIQTKPDFAVACIRIPGMGNLLYAFGETIAEPWIDIGATLFPYQRSQSSNIDFGCLNPATIAELDDIVCWLGVNEKSGPVIMYSNGRDASHLSTDGIDFKLQQLTNPANSYGFMLKQYGHVFYVITFPDDKLTYTYDFNEKAFYTLTDENISYFPAKRVAYFNGEYYFVSINDGNLYQLGQQFTNYDYGDENIYEIPRIRICPEIKLVDQSYFVAGYAGFTIESGLTNQTQRVDLSLSRDSGVTYGSVESMYLPGLGQRQNKLMWWQLGMANTLTPQFRFSGFDRFTGTDGILGVFQ